MDSDMGRIGLADLAHAVRYLADKLLEIEKLRIGAKT